MDALPSGLRVSYPEAGVALVSFTDHRPLNALTVGSAEGLPRLLDKLASEEAVRALVLTGEGGAFSAGASLDELEREPAPEALAHAFEAVRLLREMPKPTLAAVDGVAAGGAFGLALACDIRLASPRAVFRAPFIEMGLVPDYGLTSTLGRLVGLQAALELLLTARRVEATEAHRLGLVLRVVEDPLTESVAIAATIASKPQGAVAKTKELVIRGLDDDLARALDREAQVQAEALQAPEFSLRLARWREMVSSGRGVRS